MFIHEEGNFQFRSNAVSTTDKDRFADSSQIQLKQSTEAADAGEGIVGHSTGNMLFHELHGFVACSDINTSGCVGIRLGVLIHRCRPPEIPRFSVQIYFSAASSGLL